MQAKSQKVNVNLILHTVKKSFLKNYFIKKINHVP